MSSTGRRASRFRILYTPARLDVIIFFEFENINMTRTSPKFFTGHEKKCKQNVPFCFLNWNFHLHAHTFLFIPVMHLNLIFATYWLKC